ncbi:MAG: 5'-nucleotidase, lipoprotein e(P4) family [Bacteroidetes bacterium]|nr:MAG: 5'-nucleotidase, lipoprotein e(P4) family [Bacteroidota bacterium]
MRRILFYALALPLFFACSVHHYKSEEGGTHTLEKSEATQAVLFMQTSAEYRALCYQTFNFGRLRLDDYLRRMGMNLSRQYAIVVDIDETVLDNSPHAAQSILDGTSYPVGWKEWVDKREARPIPGALEFLNYAHQKGVALFYISNRKEATREATMANLREMGFPNVKEETLLLRTTTSGKEPRRKVVAQKYEILMFFGDNLADFTTLFEHKSISERFEIVDKYAADFGSRFFVLPNPTYGDWEGAIYDYDYAKSPQEKAQLRRAALKGFH